MGCSVSCRLFDSSSPPSFLLSLRASENQQKIQMKTQQKKAYQQASKQQQQDTKEKTHTLPSGVVPHLLFTPLPLRHPPPPSPFPRNPLPQNIGTDVATTETWKNKSCECRLGSPFLSLSRSTPFPFHPSPPAPPPLPHFDKQRRTNRTHPHHANVHIPFFPPNTNLRLEEACSKA